MPYLPDPYFPKSATPARCENCLPDRICGWACEQGWGVPDTKVRDELVMRYEAEAQEENSRSIQFINNAFWKMFNGKRGSG